MKSNVIILITLPLMVFAAQWQSLDGPPAGRADDMSIGLDDGEWVIYAADQRHKLYKSVNEGEYWDSIYLDENIVNPTGVVAEPNYARVIYMCKWVDYPEHAIWKSTDWGQNWLYVDDNNVTNRHLDCIAIDFNRPDTLYVGADALGLPSIFKTTNAGLTWQAKEIYYSGPGTTDPWIVDISVISDENSSLVLAVSHYSTSLRGIFRSTNAGDDWTYTLDENMYSVDFANINIAFAGSDHGVYRSMNGGDSWQLLSGSPNQTVYDIAVITENKIYIATNAGIYLGICAGDSWYWTQKNNGMRCKECLHILTHPENNNILLAGNEWSVYKSVDGGNYWDEITDGYPSVGLKRVTTNLPYVYCLGDALKPGFSSSSIFRSSDYGDSWQTLTGIFLYDGEYNPSVLEVSPAGSNLVLFGGNSAGGTEPVSVGTIFRSSDYGETWDLVDQSVSTLTHDFIHAIEFCLLQNNIVLAGYDGSTQSTSIKKSTDAGSNWMDKLIPSNPSVYSLGVNPQEDNKSLAGTQQYGVYKSSDYGENWSATGLSDGTVNALAIDFDYPDTIYAGSKNDYGIYKTTDGFASVKQVNNGLDYLYIEDIDIDSDEATIVYTLCKENASASETYVYCTVDRAGTWFDITSGLPTDKPTHDIEIDRDEPDPVYAATEQGVYTYTPDFNKSLVSSSDIATSYNNGQNMMSIEGTTELWVIYESGGVIYVTRTTDGGASWSKKMELGQGNCPVISYDPIAETPIPGVVWHYLDSENQHYIYFARHVTGNEWSEPALIVTSSSTIDPPSFVIADGNLGHLAYTEGSTVKYTKFNIFNPIPTTPEWVGTGHNPSIGYMASAINPDIHITWQDDDQIWYRHEPFGMGLAERVSHQSTTCLHPSLAIEGNVAYFVWEASGDISWRSLTCNHPFYTWGSIKPVCFTISTPSTYPVLTGGHFCSWVEEYTNNYEVYCSSYNPEVGGWTTPLNISNGATETFSNYPHVVHYQTLLGTIVYFIWTEGSAAIPQPTAPPYEIEFKTHTFGGPGEGGEDALPMYIAQCGEQDPSPFMIHRQGYTHYGSEPYKRVDYDEQYLEYEFTDLDPVKLYELEAYFYQQGYSNLPIIAKVDNYQTGTIDLPADTLIILKHLLPAMLYEDRTINIKFYGNDAVTATLVLYEYEPEPDRGGVQSSASQPGQNDVLMLNVLSNPAVAYIGINYNIPTRTDVRLSLYDITGRMIDRIVNENQLPGMYHRSFENIDLSQGIYFVRLETDDNVLVKKIILLK